MKKRVKKKSPLLRLMLAVLLTGVLTGAGFYAYCKQHVMPGSTVQDEMVNTLERMKSWFAVHRQSLHESLSASKKLVPLDPPPPEEVKFEFYDSLAEMRVHVESSAGQAESAKQLSKPVTVKQQKQVISSSQPATEVVKHDELEREFYKQLKENNT